MSEDNKKESIDVDSLSWGSAAKDCVAKVYGNLDKQPMTMAMKIEISNTMRKLAIGELTREQCQERVDDSKKHYKEGE